MSHRFRFKFLNGYIYLHTGKEQWYSKHMITRLNMITMTKYDRLHLVYLTLGYILTNSTMQKILYIKDYILWND